MRQIILDTETTGLSHAEGHRVIEIGCIEMIDRRVTRNHFHQYLQPDREIDAGAMEVHGITNAFLVDKPRFAKIADEFLQYIKGAELIIHNAPFDVGFLNHELSLLDANLGSLADYCKVIDTLAMARQMHPGQRNSLDALCKRYQVDNSHRDLHGALLDAEILADVYLGMTGGQSSFLFDPKKNVETRLGEEVGIEKLVRLAAGLVIAANSEELAAHEAFLQTIEKASRSTPLWKKMELN